MYIPAKAGIRDKPSARRKHLVTFTTTALPDADSRGQPLRSPRRHSKKRKRGACEGSSMMRLRNNTILEFFGIAEEEPLFDNIRF